MVCDLDVTESTDLDAFGIVVNGVDGPADVCGSGDHYCAWGLESSGRAFYCGWTTFGGNLVGVNLKGGEGDDVLSFLCEEGTNPLVEARLEEYPGFSHSLSFLGRIDGAPGRDIIIGSTRVSDMYADAMYGWDGNDDIASHEGNDDIDGGSSADRVCAGPGDDTVNGGPGHDDVVDEQGVNVLNGATGDDRFQGNGSPSVIDGGPGDDLCRPGGTNCTSSTTLTLHTCPS